MIMQLYLFLYKSILNENAKDEPAESYLLLVGRYLLSTRNYVVTWNLHKQSRLITKNTFSHLFSFNLLLFKKQSEKNAEIHYLMLTLVTTRKMLM